MTAFAAPPVGPDWSQWARQLGDKLARMWPKLQFRTARDTAAENGLLMWDDSLGLPVVSKDGEFLPIATNFTIELRTNDPAGPDGRVWLRTDL